MEDFIKQLHPAIKTIIIIIPILSLMVAALVFTLNLKQARRKNKIAKSKIISETLHIFLDDEIIQKSFYKIEYGLFVYNQKRFHKSKEEREIDKLLRHFSNLAMLNKNKLLDIKDIYPIQYYILRITNNKEINKYFDFIECHVIRSKIESHPYLVLRDLGKELNSKSH